MVASFRAVNLKKRYPLKISRGTSTGSTNLFVFLSDGTHTGVGECAPGTGSDESLAAPAQRQIEDGVARGVLDLSITECWSAMEAAGADHAALAALDMARWDLAAKQQGVHLRHLFGLPRRSVPTSVTVGINDPEVVAERTLAWLQQTGARYLKLKLGNQDGIEADKSSFLAAKAASAPFSTSLRVDANGGWSLTDAIHMAAWLADEGCGYIEQPLAAGEEAALHDLMKVRRLPIFLDESIRTSHDVVRFADVCDGINLKLMKTGGITEALRLVATARAHGLATMIGCMGETSVAIAAGATLGPLFDQIDLDSHLNLDPDPCEGVVWEVGAVLPVDRPGHGGSFVASA